MNFSEEKLQDQRDLFLSPFLDVMFLLLSFFMVDSIFSQLGNRMDIDLPSKENQDNSQVQISQNNEITINVAANGIIEINQVAISIENLSYILKEAKEEFGEYIRILIRSDKNANYQIILNVLDQCHSNGFNKISILRK